MRNTVRPPDQMNHDHLNLNKTMKHRPDLMVLYEGRGADVTGCASTTDQNFCNKSALENVFCASVVYLGRSEVDSSSTSTFTINQTSLFNMRAGPRRPVLQSIWSPGPCPSCKVSKRSQNPEDGLSAAGSEVLQADESIKGLLLWTTEFQSLL